MTLAIIYPVDPCSLQEIRDAANRSQAWPQKKTDTGVFSPDPEFSPNPHVTAIHFGSSDEFDGTDIGRIVDEWQRFDLSQWPGGSVVATHLKTACDFERPDMRRTLIASVEFDPALAGLTSEIRARFRSMALSGALDPFAPHVLLRPVTPTESKAWAEAPFALDQHRVVTFEVGRPRLVMVMDGAEVGLS